jgi:Mg2+-importing ATPase
VIIEGIRDGRAVFANSIKYLKATLTHNFGNFYAIAIGSLFINFLSMLPLQILLVNLLSDFPMISIATDNVDAAELSRPSKYEIREIVLIASRG